MTATLDIDLVRTFHAVARIGKFRAAAEHLHKSPAAISVHIQRLEAVAGGRLLQRDNQSVSLTPLGQRLLTATTDLLNAHDRILGDLHGTHLAGRITMGVPDEYAGHVIRDILPVFAATWPNVVLEVKTAPSYALRDQVERGKLQLALVAQPKGLAFDPSIVLVATTPVWVGALAEKSEWSGPVPLALHAADCPYHRAMLESLRHSGRQWRVVLDSPSSQAIYACVEAGLGISLVDRARVTANMQILDSLPVIPEHEVVLVRSATAAASKALDLLTEALQQRFRL